MLRRQVLCGEYDATGLPAEATLAEEFCTTRNTVRAALDLLRMEGLVDRCPGVGTTVTSRKHPHDLDHLRGLAEVFDGLGTIRNEVRALTRVRPPMTVRARLQLEDDEDVVFIERLRHLDGVPLSLDLTYVASDLGEQLLNQDLAGRDIFALLEEASGERLGHADLVLEAVTADAHSAAVLGSPRNAALLMVERLTHLSSGRPVDFEFIRFRGDRLRLRGTTRRNPVEDQ